MEIDYSRLVTRLTSAAEALGPLVAEHRTALARGPDLPAELAQALEQAGLTRLWMPRELGGAELPLPHYVRVIEALARHDGSVAWCAAIASSSTSVAGMLPSQTARELFGESGFLSGSLTPGGSAVREGDGWRVNGPRTWGSFIRYSKLTAAVFLVHENGVLRRTSEDVPMLRMALVPTQKVKILDNWDGAGLRATGSHDFVFENVWVPERHTVDMTGFAPVPHQPGALYALPLVTAFALGLTGVPLGIARASIDALLTLASSKIPHGLESPLREQAGVQSDVAHAETLLRAARAFVFEAAEEFWNSALTGGAPTWRERATVRMACWNAAQAAKQVVDLMYSAAGGTAAHESSPFAVQLRDVHAAATHIHFAARNMETAGRILLGMEAGTARF
jgi:alkylation response protein AidB-like acyl-CoA dehydrogenase